MGKHQRNCPIVVVLFGLLALVPVMAAAQPPSPPPFSFTGPAIAKAAVRYASTRCGEHRWAKDEIAACSTVIEDPESTDDELLKAYISRALAYIRVQMYDRALDDANEAVRRGHRSERAYEARALSHYARMEFDQAVADFSEALRLSPYSAELYEGRAMALHDRGEHDLAIADYDQAIRLAAHTAFAFSGRGEVYRDRGQFERALADYNMSIRLDPSRAIAYSGRAQVYLSTGELDRAVADYEKAIWLNPPRDEQGDMSFTLSADHRTIFAQGRLATNTPVKFKALVRENRLAVDTGRRTRSPVTVVLDSTGGQRLSGIMLGIAIRAFRFHTMVGSRRDDSSKVEPATCTSACVWAFIGGERRTAHPHSRIGVHQAYFWRAGRVQAGPSPASQKALLVPYVRAMGVDIGVVELAGSVHFKKIRILRADEARGWSVVNGFTDGS